MPSSEIELAIKIGKARLKPERQDPQFLATLSRLGINLDKEQLSQVERSRDLQSLTTHGGDNSFVHLAQQYKDMGALQHFCYFIWGINYLYPSSSMPFILPEFNRIFGMEWIHADEMLLHFEHWL